MGNKSRHYINNKEFYQQLVEYHAAVERDPETQIPEEIGLKFMKIVQRMGTRGNFVNYSFLDEMMSHALHMMTRYILKFNPERSNNPFAYFSQIAKNAFIYWINKELKNSITKRRLADIMESQGDIKTVPLSQQNYREEDYE